MPISKRIVYIAAAILFIGVLTIVIIAIIGLINTGISYMHYSVTQ